LQENNLIEITQQRQMPSSEDGYIATNTEPFAIIYTPSDLNYYRNVNLSSVSPIPIADTVLTPPIGEEITSIATNDSQLFAYAMDTTDSTYALYRIDNFETTSPNMTLIGAHNSYSTAPPGFLNIVLTSLDACVYGTSCVTMSDGTTKQIADINTNDLILMPNGESSQVELAVRCWLMPKHTLEYHSCVVFEKGSIGTNIPNDRFIVDPGHPICTITEYKNKGYNALRAARSYINDSSIKLSNYYN
jgi:hypothetical protein